jgi:PKD repeat protein
LGGLVIGTDGKVLSGATVLILDGTNQGRSTTTNSFGRYMFTGLTPANANLAARASGYFESRSGLYIDGTASLDFALTPEPPPQSREDPKISISVERVASGPGYLELRFTAESNVELDDYEWEFGPASAHSNKRVEQHNYTQEGDYTVRVSARTKEGRRLLTGSVDVSVRFN